MNDFDNCVGLSGSKPLSFAYGLALVLAKCFYLLSAQMLWFISHGSVFLVGLRVFHPALLLRR